MSTVTQLRPRTALRMVRPPAPGFEASGPEGIFWCGAVGGAMSVAAQLSVHLDVMSGSLVRLPQRAGLARPAVAAYLATIKSLAEQWRSRLRPALGEAAAALACAGAAITQPSARRGHAVQARPLSASSLPPALVRRMARALSLLQDLSAEFDRALVQVVRASSDLDTDTVQLTQRLQADQLHALMLSQQASTLQSKLDDATMRQHAYWLLGPHAEQIRQEIAMHSSAREGVRRQLDHLRAEQAAVQAESRYLEQLLPSLSTYLAGMDRLGAALRAMLGGSTSLLNGWRALRTDHAGQPRPGADLASDAAAPYLDNAGATITHALRAAAPHWETLAAHAARLRLPAASGPLTTPAGYQT